MSMSDVDANVDVDVEFDVNGRCGCHFGCGRSYLGHLPTHRGLEES